MMIYVAAALVVAALVAMASGTVDPLLGLLAGSIGLGAIVVEGGLAQSWRMPSPTSPTGGSDSWSCSRSPPRS